MTSIVVGRTTDPDGQSRAPLVLDDATSARLGRIRQRDTEPEQRVRKLLHGMGYRFRVSNRDLPGSPDLANRHRHWAVLVHGCFWHAHHGCHRATIPKRNRAFWVKKFETNRARDARAVRALRGLGYTTVVVWECETENADTLTSRLRQELRHVAS